LQVAVLAVDKTLVEVEQEVYALQHLNLCLMEQIIVLLLEQEELGFQLELEAMV
jgi:hypothetical protein